MSLSELKADWSERAELGATFGVQIDGVLSNGLSPRKGLGVSAQDARAGPVHVSSSVEGVHEDRSTFVPAGRGSAEPVSHFTSPNSLSGIREVISLLVELIRVTVQRLQ
ncbi:hypothetical protein ICW40_05685 [Actinotalea ferrariae]|nr:hypothetical protein [Actinotalea ferrariae]